MRANTRTHHGFLIVTWIIVQAVLLFKNGIVTWGEATKYISEANSIFTTGKTVSPNFWFYSLQSLLLVIDKAVGADYYLVLTVQLALNLCATFLFYLLVRKLTDDRTAMVCAVLLLFNYPYQEFNTFLQTESIYFSLCLIFSYHLISMKEHDPGRLLLITILLLLLSISRPPGLFYILVTMLYICSRTERKQEKKPVLFACLTGAVLFFVLLNFTVDSGGRFNFTLPVLTGQVICLVPETLPASDIQLSDNPNTLRGIMFYIVQNPLHFTKLAVMRALAFFGLIRPYFSVSHNFFLAIFFYPLYVLAFLNIGRWFTQQKPIAIYLVTTVLIVLFTTMLTCDDWHNRFFLSISPFIIILAAPALQHITRSICPRQPANTKNGRRQFHHT